MASGRRTVVTSPSGTPLDPPEVPSTGEVMPNGGERLGVQVVQMWVRRRGPEGAQPLLRDRGPQKASRWGGRRAQKRSCRLGGPDPVILLAQALSFCAWRSKGCWISNPFQGLFQAAPNPFTSSTQNWAFIKWRSRQRENPTPKPLTMRPPPLSRLRSAYEGMFAGSAIPQVVMKERHEFSYLNRQ